LSGLEKLNFLQSENGDVSAVNDNEIDSEKRRSGSTMTTGYKYQEFKSSKPTLPFGKFDMKNIQFSLDDFEIKKNDFSFLPEDVSRYIP
jgi:hypothetical protein